MPPITSELCLACSGSAFSGSQKPKLPPCAKLQVSQESEVNQQKNGGDSEGEGEKRGKASLEPSVFRTQCCKRPICSACLTSNPRLARYAPCLACLGGVRAVAVAAHSASNSGTFIEGGGSINGCKQRWERESESGVDVDVNLDGAFRDRDVFVLGDDDDDDDHDSDSDSDLDLDLGQGVKKKKKKRKSVPGAGGGGGAASDSDSTFESPPPAYSDSELVSGPDAKLPPSNRSPSITANTGTRTRRRRPPVPGVEPTGRKAAGRSNGSALEEEEEEETEELKKKEEARDVERPNTHTPAPSSTTTPVPVPQKHYVQKDDTLRGLALRYNIEGRVLCRLNNLPPSTLTTTPHLLHTRAVLVLPPSARHFPPPGPPGVNVDEDEDEDRGRHHRDHESEDDPERERQIEIEKTAKRIQLITKEANWDVAKAYAVLAQDSSTSISADFRNINIDVNGNVNSRSISNRNRLASAEKEKEINELGEEEGRGVGVDVYRYRYRDRDRDEHFEGNYENENGNEEEKEKESPRPRRKENMNVGGSGSTVRERALDAYLEDDVWEEGERRAGRGPGSVFVGLSGCDWRR